MESICTPLDVPARLPLMEKNVMSTDYESPTSSCAAFPTDSSRKRKWSEREVDGPSSCAESTISAGTRQDSTGSSSPHTTEKPFKLMKSSSFEKTMKRINSDPNSPTSPGDSEVELDHIDVKNHIEDAARNKIKSLQLQLEACRVESRRLSHDRTAKPSALREATALRKSAETDLASAKDSLSSYLTAYEVFQNEETLMATGNTDAESLEAARRAVQINETELSNVLRISFDNVATTGQVSPMLRSNSSDRTMGEWVLAEIQQMPNSKLTKACVETILSSDNFALLTGENPFALAHDDCANNVFNNMTKVWLEERGLVYHATVGRYDHGERSFLVEGMTRAQAQEFAGKFGQESVAHKQGLVMECGSCILFDGNGPTFIDSVSHNSNHFSALKDKDGNIIAFNFTPTDEYLEPEFDPEQPYDTLRG